MYFKIFPRTRKQSWCKDSYRVSSFVSNGSLAPNKRSAVVGHLHEAGGILGGVRVEVVLDSVQAKYNLTIADLQFTNILSFVPHPMFIHIHG